MTNANSGIYPTKEKQKPQMPYLIKFKSCVLVPSEC